MPKNSWDPERYDEDHSFVWRYAKKILQLLDPQPNERVLDLGCGTGHLTAEIAKAGASVVGIDQSSEMVSKAKSNYPDLDFEMADARCLPFKSDFDAVFSNAVLHWVRPPQKVVESVYTAAKPGGRFVAEFGAFGNINSILRALSTALNEQGVTEAESKFFYPRVASYKALLLQDLLIVYPQTCVVATFDVLVVGPVVKGCCFVHAPVSYTHLTLPTILLV